MCRHSRSRSDGMRKVLLHGHMFKHAGSTFDWSLKRSFGERFVDHRDDVAMRRGAAAYLRRYLQEHSDVAALSSHHLCCPLPGIPGTELIRAFLLRHPIERIWSVYHFERRQEASTPGAIHAKQYSFREYVAWRMRDDVNPSIRNFQTRFCSHLVNRPRVKATHETLQEARETLESTPLIGVVEAYEDSMLLFEAALHRAGLDVDLAYLPQNTARDHDGVDLSFDEKLEQVTSALGPLYELVLEQNRLDLALYEHAQSLLAGRFTEYVVDPTAARAAMRRRCAALPRWRHGLRLLARRLRNTSWHRKQPG
jgi:hypothetical protein